MYINHRPQEVEAGEGEGDADGGGSGDGDEEAVGAEVTLSGVWAQTQNNRKEKREKLLAMTHPQHRTTTTTNAFQDC